MSNNNKQPPDLTDSLPVATGGLTMEDPVGQVNALESQLKAIGEQDSDFLENLNPAIRKRVEVLRGIQNEHDELEAKFFEEKAKYQNLYAPLYSKRYDIVTGAVDVDGAKEEDAMDKTDDTEKGVPEFWLTAMKHNKITAEKITERDEEALKYLKDVKCCRMDDPKGFKLEFFFDTNPFFTNSVLTKVYHMRSSVYYHKLIIEKTIGTTIEWLPGKCLTEGGASFFKFFGPWFYGYSEFDLTIRDKIIPHAVSWFTGEANQEDFGGFDNEDDEDDDDDWIEEDDDEGDEDDEDEEETETKNKSQLKAIEGQDSDLLENLKPAVRKRVEVLRGIQSEHDELEAKYFEEKAKYQKVIAPLYSKRYDIVTGAVEVDGAKEEDAMDQTDGTEKGVPEFWLTAMKHNEFRLLYLSYTITERDEEALKYLKDIKWCRIDDPKGFKLEFFFDTNPFFTNSFLTKVYHMRSSCYFDKLILEKAIGTTIEWLPGKCLTQMILEMKPKKGSKNAKPITKTQDCASFFNFFSPPEEGRHLMKEDYYVGLSIRDKIIPHAVSLFAGEAIPTRGRKISVLLGGFYDEDDDDYEDDDLELAFASYDKHPASVKNFGIRGIKTQVAQRFPSQSVQASITGVKPGKKNDRLDIPASSKKG